MPRLYGSPATCLLYLRIVIIFMAFGLMPFHLKAETKEPGFHQLQERLIKDGFDKKYIQALYQRESVKLELRGISLYSSHQEATINYEQYLTRKMVRKARRYIEEYLAELTRAEKDFGVEKEIITAVMLVETRLGTYTGGRPILNTLSSMAVLAESDVRNYIWEEAVKGNRERKDFDSWADRKSQWAYQELKAFLTYALKYHIDPMELNGSYAGALGFPQFMPSNIIAYAKDGNGDGRIDLFNHADAIASIANYLKQFGWKPGIDRDAKFKVLMRYNYSSYYVNTILELNERLKG